MIYIHGIIVNSIYFNKNYICVTHQCTNYEYLTGYRRGKDSVVLWLIFEFKPLMQYLKTIFL